MFCARLFIIIGSMREASAQAGISVTQAAIFEVFRPVGATYVAPIG